MLVVKKAGTQVPAFLFMNAAHLFTEKYNLPDKTAIRLIFFVQQKVTCPGLPVTFTHSRIFLKPESSEIIPLNTVIYLCHRIVLRVIL